MNKEAEDIVGDAAKGITEAAGKVTGGLGTASKIGWEAYMTALGLAGGLGLGAGFITSRLSSPSVIADTSDREMELNAYRTEIGTTIRRIADLQSKQRGNPTKKHDRFL